MGGGGGGQVDEVVMRYVLNLLIFRALRRMLKKGPTMITLSVRVAFSLYIRISFARHLSLMMSEALNLEPRVF